MKKFLKNSAALLFGIAVAVIILEVFLHFYNPFQTRLSGNVITLPVNQKYEFNNVKFHGLDAHIVHTKNKYGFRGPVLDDNFYNHRIIFVGGSTTECYYLNDGKDWPAICTQKLNSGGQKLWYNNAGLDGHSTFGHTLLLGDHVVKYKPDYVFFLVGANDMANAGLNRFENAVMGNKKRFLQNFELYNLYLNFKLSALAKKRGVAHTAIDFNNIKTVDTTDAQKPIDLSIEITKYKTRLMQLYSICKTHHIVPVFISQPCLLKPQIDPETKKNTGTYPFMDHSGLQYYHSLDQYNKATQQFCKENNVYFIDAAQLMPSSSEYYYDYFHYTSSGAACLGNIIANEITRLNIISPDKK